MGATVGATAGATVGATVGQREVIRVHLGVYVEREVRTVGCVGTGYIFVAKRSHSQIASDNLS